MPLPRQLIASRLIPEFLWGDLRASTLNQKPTLPSNDITLIIAIASIFSNIHFAPKATQILKSFQG
jgi:hypothetical protein